MKRYLYIALIVVGASLQLLWAVHCMPPYWKYISDFPAFYTGGQLAGTPHLYDVDAQREIQKKTISHPVSKVLLFVKPGFFAWYIKPLTFFSFETAYNIWFFEMLFFVGLLIYLWPGDKLLLSCILAWSFPLFSAFRAGQDTPMLLCLFFAGLYLMMNDKQEWAGVVWALLFAKFHLFLFLPLYLIRVKAWRVIWGGVMAMIPIMLFCSWANGGAPLSDWIHMLKSSQIEPALYAMPNLRGMTYYIPAYFPVFLIAVLCLCAVSLAKAPWLSLTSVLIAGLLVSPHTWGFDLVILIPGLIVLLNSEFTSRCTKLVSVFLMIPIPYMFFPFFVIPASLVVLLSCIAWDSLEFSKALKLNRI
jgi:hypothetical protein